MNKIIVLTKNETEKALSKKVVILFVWASLLLVFILGLRIKDAPGYFSEYTMEKWRVFLQSEIEQNNSMINDPTIGYSSQSVLTEMINQNKVYQYQLDNDIPPILGNSASTLVLKTNEVFLFIIICVIVLSCYLITTEYANGTMSRLLVTGAKRWKILLSKYLSVIILSFAFMIVFILCAILCGWIMFGFDDFSVKYVFFNGSEVVARNVLTQIVHCFCYNFLSLFSIVSLAIMIAVLTRSNLLGMTISFGVATFGSLLCMAFPDSSLLKYTLFANTDYSRYLMGTVGYGQSTPLFSLAVLVIHAILFIAVSFAVYTHRDVAD